MNEFALIETFSGDKPSSLKSETHINLNDITLAEIIQLIQKIAEEYL